MKSGNPSTQGAKVLIRRTRSTVRMVIRSAVLRRNGTAMVASRPRYRLGCRSDRPRAWRPPDVAAARHRDDGGYGRRRAAPSQTDLRSERGEPARRLHRSLNLEPTGRSSGLRGEAPCVEHSNVFSRVFDQRGVGHERQEDHRAVASRIRQVSSATSRGRARRRPSAGLGWDFLLRSRRLLRANCRAQWAPSLIG